MTKVRHLVERPGAARAGGGARYFWKPTVALRAAGWRYQRLPDHWPDAVAKAEAINAEVDAWRRGETPPMAPRAAARARARAAAAGTVNALILDYKRSRWWEGLAERTRRDYGWCLDAIGAWAGDMPVAAVTPPAVEAFYQAQLRRVEGAGRQRRVVETPAKAAAIVRVLRLLLNVGRRLGYRLHQGMNPAERPGLVLERQREPVLWQPVHVAQLVEAADRLGWRSVGTLILVNEWAGQREEDLIRLPPWAAGAGALEFRQGKTGRRVCLPLHVVPHLVTRLEAEAARPAAVASLTHLVVNDRTGLPWNLHTFRHVWAEVRAAAAEGLAVPSGSPLAPLQPMPEVSGLWFMELRHTAVTRLHEAGVDALGISGITGHTPGSVRNILDRHYLVRTAKAAEGAFRRRLAAEARDV